MNAPPQVVDLIVHDGMQAILVPLAEWPDASQNHRIAADTYILGEWFFSLARFRSRNFGDHVRLPQPEPRPLAIFFDDNDAGFLERVDDLVAGGSGKKVG